MTLKKEAKIFIEVLGRKEGAVAEIKKRINFHQIYGTFSGVKYWTKVLREIEK